MLILLLFLSFSVDSDGQPTTPHIEENILQRPKKYGLLPVKKMPNFFFSFCMRKKNKINFNEYNVNHFNYNNMKYRDFQ